MIWSNGNGMGTITMAATNGITYICVRAIYEPKKVMLMFFIAGRCLKYNPRIAKHIYFRKNHL